MKRFLNSLRASVTLLLILTLLLGGIYPLVIMGVAQTFFTHRANGSLIERGDKIIGSSLLGQEFSSPKYFWGRLSATMPPYNPAASTGSNFNPANPKLLQAADVHIAALQKADPGNKSLIPVDLVTASASGVDPHISVASMLYQLPRVARARGMTEDAVKALAVKATEMPFLEILGEPYVNVVRLNLSLDEAKAGTNPNGK